MLRDTPVQSFRSLNDQPFLFGKKLFIYNLYLLYKILLKVNVKRAPKVLMFSSRQEVNDNLLSIYSKNFLVSDSYTLTEKGN